MHIASRPNEGTSVSLWLPVAQVPVSTKQSLDAPDRSRGRHVASSWSTMIRLCSQPLRTCCASWGMKRSKPLPQRTRLSFCEVEDARISRSLTTRCPKCLARFWRTWSTISILDCRCFWRPATRTAKTRQEACRDSTSLTLSRSWLARSDCLCRPRRQSPAESAPPSFISRRATPRSGTMLGGASVRRGQVYYLSAGTGPPVASMITFVRWLSASCSRSKNRQARNRRRRGSRLRRGRRSKI